MRNESDETPKPESEGQPPVSQANLLDKAGIPPSDDFELGSPYCGTDGPCEGCQ